jgi:hypothetical protein
MAYWKTEHSFVPQFTPHVLIRHPDLAALVAIGVAPGLLLLWFVPLPLVLPALSIVSFVSACFIGLFAHYSGVDRHAPGITLWDMAALFTSIWIGAGIVSGPKHLVELFEHLTMAP